jgi:hypothetical protein
VRLAYRSTLPTEPLNPEPLGVALPANDVHLINWAENFLMTIQGNGILERLTQFWFTNPSWMQELP